MKAYFYGEFSAPVSYRFEATKNGKQITAVGTNTKSLDFRYGVSFISVDQARKNLQREIPGWGLLDVSNAARARWNQVLGRITVEGGTETQRKVFYTALYRSSERMVNITEDGRYYSKL